MSELSVEEPDPEDDENQPDPTPPSIPQPPPKTSTRVRSIKRRTVGDILAAKDAILADPDPISEGLPARKRHRSAHNTDLEKALFIWFTQVRTKNIPVTGDMIIEKGKQYGTELGISNFKYSEGWLTRFKQRHGISSRIISGESTGIDVSLITDGRKEAIEVMKNYDLKDIYNIDETGLFYRMLPDRSLSTSDHVKGTKKMKDRITIALVCNADGSDKLKPFVIGKALNPRSFKDFNAHLYVDYTANKKAWMTSLIFCEFFRKFNARMRRENRKVLLIMDNAPSHAEPLLSNVRIHYLPPTTTSHLQPLDAGIIQCFKSYYRQKQLKHLIHCIDDKQPPIVPLDKDIRFVKRAWDEVSPTTIQNCWRHSGLTVNAHNDHDISTSTDSGEEDFSDLLAEAYRRLEIDDDMQLSVAEFVGLDKNSVNCDTLTDDMIMDSITRSDDAPSIDGDESEYDDDFESKVPTTNEAKSALEKVLRFCETFNDKDVIEKCIYIQDFISKSTASKSKQSTLDTFFK
ncbi:tigger transposable element-derived protein 6-like [Ostrea edulis]|uniref:tigger transposable element-derived protein 6-like n=1 Tax=Ostrea edulis TaxID=37623 RepID=UPI0024AFEE2F|nr:tigger transposable element-derived protein 6-like [Ostrea edulis]